MPTPPRGLGRGLDALLGGRPATGASADHPEVRLLPLASIRPNPQQPRTIFSGQALEDLTSSIRSQGVLQPILVRPKRGEGGQRYEIVAGERRFRAAGQAGLTEIPALVREMTAEESLTVALIENLQRENLNPLEEARGMRELMDRLDLTQDELSKKIGKSRASVANTLRLLTLPQQAQVDLEQGRLSAGHCRAVLSVDTAEGQETLRRLIVEAALSVREAEDLAMLYKAHGSFPPRAARGETSQGQGADENAVGDGHFKGGHAGGGAYGAARPGRASPEFKAAAREISAALGLPVRVSAGAKGGSVTIRANSVEAFEQLLAALRTLG